MAPDSPAPIEFSTYTEMMDALAEKFPAGGTLHLRLDNGWNDAPDYLFMEQVVIEGEDDYDFPEEMLGQDLYEKVDSTVNRLVVEDTLPDYTRGQKYHDLTWKAAPQA